jgi:hypothetical protein
MKYKYQFASPTLFGLVVSVSDIHNHKFAVVQKLGGRFLIDSATQDVLKLYGRTMIAKLGPHWPSTIMDYVLGDGVGHHVASMFQIEGTMTEVRATRLINEGVWENIDDIVGNRSRLETGIQYKEH